MLKLIALCCHYNHYLFCPHIMLLNIFQACIPSLHREISKLVRFVCNNLQLHLTSPNCAADWQSKLKIHHVQYYLLNLSITIMKRKNWKNKLITWSMMKTNFVVNVDILWWEWTSESISIFTLCNASLYRLITTSLFVPLVCASCTSKINCKLGQAKFL